MSAAFVTKVLARRAANLPLHPQDIVRFLHKKNEKDFVLLMAHKPKDIDFYLNAWRATKKLSKPHRNAMQRALGMEIDLLNILWMYRLKRFYGVAGSATYGFLIPICYKLDSQATARLAAHKTVSGFVSEVEGTAYGSVFSDFLQAEERLQDAVKTRYREEGRRSYIALACGALKQH